MDDEDSTVWCGNLPTEVDEELLYELFLQAAPLKRVRIPNDNKSGRPANYAFVTFKHEVSVAYAVSLLHGTKLYGKNIIVRHRNSNSNHSPMANIPMSLPAPRQQFNPKAQSRNHHEDGGYGNKGSNWVPYNKENRRGDGKHHRFEGHYNNNRNNNRGGNRNGPNNRYNDGNEHYGNNRRRY